MQALCLPLTSLCNSGHNPRGRAVLANSAAEHRGSGLVWQCPGKALHLVQGTAEPTASPPNSTLPSAEERAGLRVAAICSDARAPARTQTPQLMSIFWCKFHEASLFEGNHYVFNVCAHRLIFTQWCKKLSCRGPGGSPWWGTLPDSEGLEG